MSLAGTDARARRLGIPGAVLAALLLVVVIAISVSAYLGHRSAEDYSMHFGALDDPDRVNVSVWIDRVDTSSQTVTTEIVDVQPSGNLADSDGLFAEDAVLDTSAHGDPFTLRRGQPFQDTQRRFAVDGTVTDYPFDQYRSTLTFSATGADGTGLPVAVTIWSDDPFFQNTLANAPQAGADDDGTVAVALTATRSTPTLVFALFVMVLMLGLAIAAATAGYYVLRGRRGLIFPACSMMAAMLFALVPIRNAVPGSPPIGSVIDFASFFIAEIIISTALIASVVIGYRMQIANDIAER
jgi:hypothetical protein